MGRGRKSTTKEDLRKMQRSSVNWGDGGGDSGGGGGGGDDAESSELNFSGSYSPPSAGDHSSDDNALNSQGSHNVDDTARKIWN